MDEETLNLLMRVDAVLERSWEVQQKVRTMSQRVNHIFHLNDRLLASMARFAKKQTHKSTPYDQRQARIRS